MWGEVGECELCEDLRVRMSVGRIVYNVLFCWIFIFVVIIVIGVFVFERVFDEGMDNLWENMNWGVSCNCF